MTPTVDRQAGRVCVYHTEFSEDIKEIKTDVKTILAAVAVQTVEAAKRELRVKWLERIVYSAVALVLLAVVGVVLDMVLKR